MPKSPHRAESRADRSSSVVFASHPVEGTRRKLVLQNLCGISAAPGLSVAGRATVWYSGALSSLEVSSTSLVTNTDQELSKPSVELSYCLENQEASSTRSAAREPGMFSLIIGMSGQIRTPEIPFDRVSTHLIQSCA